MSAFLLNTLRGNRIVARCTRRLPVELNQVYGFRSDGVRATAIVCTTHLIPANYKIRTRGE